MPDISIIAGSFHKEQIERMVAEARKVSEELSIGVQSVLWVPGSYEVPLILKQQLAKSDVDGAVLLGIIERGETKHGLVMAEAVLPKVLDIQLDFYKPVGIGILGPEILDHQIEPRLLPHARAAVEAVSSMFKLLAE